MRLKPDRKHYVAIDKTQLVCHEVGGRSCHEIMVLQVLQVAIKWGARLPADLIISEHILTTSNSRI